MSTTRLSGSSLDSVSVLFSEPKIPQFVNMNTARARMRRVSVLFSEPKIPQSSRRRRLATMCPVSVLFSEPKIPQSSPAASPSPTATLFQCSSASRKFLNARPVARSGRRVARFQCSSASRKFLNSKKINNRYFKRNPFQCSSASRKFLNRPSSSAVSSNVGRFSALQRAENSSMGTSTRRWCRCWRVSVLFSEPKIPQWH